MLHLEWEGTLVRDGDVLYGEADHTMTRKYWYSPLGLEQYLDLVRRAVETRHRVWGNVRLPYYDDDGAYVSLRFRIDTTETNLGRAYDEARRVATEVEEAGKYATDEVGQRIAEIAAWLSGWGSESLDAFVDAVDNAVSHLRYQGIECKATPRILAPDVLLHCSGTWIAEYATTTTAIELGTSADHPFAE